MRPAQVLLVFWSSRLKESATDFSWSWCLKHATQISLEIGASNRLPQLSLEVGSSNSSTAFSWSSRLKESATDFSWSWRLKQLHSFLLKLVPQTCYSDFSWNWGLKEYGFLSKLRLKQVATDFSWSWRLKQGTTAFSWSWRLKQLHSFLLKLVAQTC
jgi:hypothetical protein